MINNINVKKLIRKLAYIIIIINIISVLIFILYSYKNLGFNSDSAVRVLLANEIYNSGNYFPKDWFFVNGDIWVFSAHTLIIPLIKYFPAGYGLYAISSVLMSAAIVMSVNALLTALKIEKNSRLIVLAVFTSGISLAITENIFGQISYGLIVLYYCLLLYGIFEVINKNNKITHKSKIIVFVTLLIIFCSNPLRGTVFFIVPMGLTLIYYLALSYKESTTGLAYEHIKKIIFLMVFSATVGIALNKVILNNIEMNSGVTQLQWLPLSEMMKKIVKVITSLLFILGGEPYANRSLFTISGIYDGFRLITVICFFLLVPLSLRRVFKTEKYKNIKILTIFSCCAFAVVALIMISTNIYNARYLLPAVVLIIFIVYALPFDLKNNLIFDVLRIVTIVGFITNTLVINTGYWATYRVSETHKDDSQSFNDLSKLAQYLKRSNLKYGYATFWNAGSLTVLTDSVVQVRQIYIENGMPQKYKWLSSNSWYMPRSLPMETFLLLTKQEDEAMNWELMKSEYNLVPESKINFDEYQIYIFNENISNKLISWQN